MMSKTQKKVQAEKFRQVARELGCDEDEAAFDDKLRRIAKSPPIKADNKEKTPDK